MLAIGGRIARSGALPGMPFPEPETALASTIVPGDEAKVILLKIVRPWGWQVVLRIFNDLRLETLRTFLNTHYRDVSTEVPVPAVDGRRAQSPHYAKRDCNH